MSRLRYTAAANQSLENIARYIRGESGNAVVARRFTDYLRQRCAEMAALPFQLSRRRPELRPDLRSIAVGNYIIFFRYVGDVLEVIDVLAGHRDTEAYFNRDEC